jgi:hypothetical protein
MTNGYVDGSLHMGRSKLVLAFFKQFPELLIFALNLLNITEEPSQAPKRLKST